MKDEIVIAQAFSKEIRIHAARMTGTVEQARIAHHCMPSSAAALGRTMTAAAIMASDLKNEDEKIVAVINGHGPAGTILVQAKGNGDVRGFISDPSVYYAREDGHLDVARTVGTDGTLTVIRDMGLKDTFSGVVKLQSGEIGEDFTYYFTVSEQTPSAVSVGVLVDPDGSVIAAGGLIIQLMPNASEEAVTLCEKAVASLRPATDLISEGYSPEEIIRMYFPDAEILGSRDVRWHCGCSREHYRKALSVLQDADLEEMIEDGKGAEITCQFCGNTYFFNTEDLKEILENKRAEDRQSLS
ncbi:MAG: Hsp33 family molecular chaperone HslO [Solobacterium sp.]|nr:Hsp33 family molecular chaperone HslO [Solobacterium sp.]